MAIQGEETTVRIAQEREGEIAGVEIDQARDLLDALRKTTSLGNAMNAANILFVMCSATGYIN